MRWEESYAHEDNKLALLAIFKYIRTKDAEYSPAAVKALRAISDEDLLNRIHTKYQDLQKSLRSAKLLASSRSTTAAVDSALATTRDVKLTKGMRQSRQHGVRTEFYMAPVE